MEKRTTAQVLIVSLLTTITITACVFFMSQCAMRMPYTEHHETIVPSTAPMWP